jgi:teichuronic acid biosynthesis glycosyltransferase TuaG
MRTRVTIITPTLEINKELIECAVSAKSFYNPGKNLVVQHIFVLDGGNLDSSLWNKIQFLEHEFYKVELIKLVSNQGVAFARNEAIKNSDGDYLMFLDSDDTFEPQKIAEQVKLMRQKNANFSHTGFVEFSDKSGREWKVGAGKNITADILKKRCPICTSSVCISREWLAGVMDVSENLFPDQKMRSDWLGWFKLAKKKGFHPAFVSGYFVRRRIGTNSLTANKLKTMIYNYRVYRQTGHSIISSSAKAVLYPIDSLKRRVFHQG